jgi:hypothetical protein
MSTDWTLPDDWTDSARDVFLGVLDERPDLAGAELSSLSEAAALHSAADRLDEAARAAGMIATAANGTVVVHPAATESRRHRTAAATILARLASASTGATTNSQRGRNAANARWHGAHK